MRCSPAASSLLAAATQSGASSDRPALSLADLAGETRNVSRRADSVVVLSAFRAGRKCPCFRIWRPDAPTGESL